MGESDARPTTLSHEEAHADRLVGDSIFVNFVNCVRNTHMSLNPISSQSLTVLFIYLHRE